jgi:hypothetical protein
MGLELGQIRLTGETPPPLSYAEHLATPRRLRQFRPVLRQSARPSRHSGK